MNGLRWWTASSVAVAVAACTSVPVANRLKIDTGRPSVWSLGQAHYLLARMHAANRKLTTKLPDQDALDPNRIAATRLDALRSSLKGEVQYDQTLGVTNQLAMQRTREAEARRERAVSDRDVLQAKVDALSSEIASLDEEIAPLKEEKKQREDARGRSTPPLPPTAEDNERDQRISVLEARRKTKDEARTEDKARITALTTTIDSAPAAPTLAAPTFATGAGSIPNPDAFKTFMDNALKEAGKPDLSASMKLENFIGMQYEIIARQLTLLRDEVGPDDRVVFLELPASIYTVDGAADDYVAQVEWVVTDYYDTEPIAEVQRASLRRSLLDEGKSEEQAGREVQRIFGDPPGAKDAGAPHPAARTAPQKLPITLQMIRDAWKEPPGKRASERPAASEAVRAIDLIPRQSALNVNEYHATVKETGLLAALKFLVGFGAKVDYQRQRELYDQFTQQQLFASGYGKGSNRFGWTYGPQPGTRRIAPGLRTTFAVLVVPRNTLALKIKSASRFYKRNRSPLESPDHVVTQEGQELVVAIPGPRTQEFWIDEISYTPVRKGKRVTAIVEGRYFSPQMGVLVNGVPLQPAISMARTAGAADEAPPPPVDGVAGEFEITNSRHVVLGFSMGEAYVGTPILTFTSPERITAINYFDDLVVNHHQQRTSLTDHALIEPMFLDDFGVSATLDAIDAAQTCGLAASAAPLGLARLRGTGLRPHGEISVDGRDFVASPRAERGSLQAACTLIRANPGREFTMQETTEAYLAYSSGLAKPKRTVRYRQPTSQGYEERSFKQDLSVDPLGVTVRSYSFHGRRAEVRLTVSAAPGGTISAVDIDEPSGGTCGALRRDGNDVRVTCVIPSDGSRERDRISARVRLTVRGKAHDEYRDVALPVSPKVTRLSNPRNGKPEGWAHEEPTVVFSGVHLRGVSAVMFGDARVDVSPGAESMTARVPARDGVPKGKSVSVPVSLVTPAGTVPSGWTYTFRAEPAKADQS
jgi:hypothetical protein